MSHHEIAARSAEVLQLVSIDPIHLNSYPHQLSGGMRQRAMIAMSLLFTPDLIVMDEPTSALDVVGQRSLMRQIKELQNKLGFAVIFVTHDISLVRHFSDRLLVMYAGQVAELGSAATLRDAPSPLRPRSPRGAPLDPRREDSLDRHRRLSSESRVAPTGMSLPTTLRRRDVRVFSPSSPILSRGRVRGAMPALHERERGHGKPGGTIESGSGRRFERRRDKVAGHGTRCDVVRRRDSWARDRWATARGVRLVANFPNAGVLVREAPARGGRRELRDRSA